MDKRIEELLKKQYPFINPIQLEEIFMKLEAQSIISVYRVSKNKNMIVYNKYNKVLKEDLKKDL